MFPDVPGNFNKVAQVDEGALPSRRRQYHVDRTLESSWSILSPEGIRIKRYNPWLEVNEVL